MPLTLSQLIKAVGDDSITLQNLGQSVTNLQVKMKPKRHGVITFMTEAEHVEGYMREVTQQEPSPFVGLVLWVPREKLEKMTQRG